MRVPVKRPGIYISAKQANNSSHQGFSLQNLKKRGRDEGFAEKTADAADLYGDLYDRDVGLGHRNGSNLWYHRFDL
jgi:hypothetical protein